MTRVFITRDAESLSKKFPIFDFVLNIEYGKETIYIHPDSDFNEESGDQYAMDLPDLLRDQRYKNAEFYIDWLPEEEAERALRNALYLIAQP